ncbi:leucine carboxyl methyltransferase [Obba rivulosa]|uniref:Leucine carboxyl methyltransferase 1 n=1 Tax=Obba rivulosa TaxID=1052685 RepID=A0A8E2AYV3_9APHY|nr:leucine carboxyl methyltransferase [Obba rivulosa]
MEPPVRQTHARRDDDGAIRATDSDAALARLSAVSKHYLSDPFIKSFVSRPHLQQPRPPLINIGTYVRSEGLDALVDQWLELAQADGTQAQVVSLGAGSDTRFWRIATGPRRDALRAYVELDFAENTIKKAMAIRKSKELSAVLGPPENVTLAGGGTTLHSPIYHLLPADLRLPPSEVLTPLLSTPTPGSSEPLLSPSHPTLLLFECVLVYMAPAASSRLVQWFTGYFESGVLGGLIYEMYGLEDNFGNVMKDNLRARGISLPGVEPFTTFASVQSRFAQYGFVTSHALSLREIRRSYISPAERERISQLEMLDEIEELELVLEHYAISWGVQLPQNKDTLKARWDTWGLVPYGPAKGV